MKLSVYVMNHKTRDGTPVKTDLENAGFENVKIMTDDSDYYKTRDVNRLKGVQSNYKNILLDFLSSDNEYALICQDDIRLMDNAYEQVSNAMTKQQSMSIVMFYFFKNKATIKAKNSGLKYAKSTPRGLTMQMTMVSRVFAEKLLEWHAENSIDGYYWESTSNGGLKVSGEDAFIQEFCRKYKIPMWWHFPILCKHGDNESSLGNHGGRVDW